MIKNDEQLSQAILDVKKYLIGKIKEEMDGTPIEKLKKSKMVIVEGKVPPEEDEDSSELDSLKGLIGEQSCDESPEEEEMSEDDDIVNKIKQAMMSRKGQK